MNEQIERLRHALIARGAKNVEVTLIDDGDTVCVKALFTRGTMASNFWFYMPSTRASDVEPIDLADEVLSVLRAEADRVFDQLGVRR